MKRPAYLPLLCLWFAAAGALSAAPIQNLKFTDVVKDVKVLNVATKQETTAKVGDILAPPNVIKTGADSRAELVAEDQTVTRVGANTIFSVEANSRDVNIAKGSVLFHSPAGKGGGNIKSAGATASVLGTTLIVGANQSGGFKVMLLEGKGQVTGAGGGASKLNAGQMSFAMPGRAPSQPLNFELKGQVSGSKLVGGFSKPLASIAKIEAAVAVQQSKLESGKLESTGLMIGDSPNAAFKLDSAVVRVTAEAVKEVQEQIKRVIIEQEKVEPKTEVPTRDRLDPRFLLAVRARLNLTENSTPEAFEQPIPITLEPFTSSKASGNYTEKNYGAPLNIPGNREPFGLMTLLLAENFEFALSSMDNSPGFFLNAPFIEGKNFSGILALQNIDIQKSVDFLDPTEYAEASTAIPKNFLISAGRTITAESGTVMKANAAIFDVYTAGTSFSSADSRDGFLTETGGDSKVPLTLTNSMIWNDWQDGENGLLRIQAPEIIFRNQTLSVGGSLGAIEIGASGNIHLSAEKTTLDALKSNAYVTARNAGQTSAQLNSILQGLDSQHVSLPLGFGSIGELAIQAYKVSIRSSGNAIRIEGVPIWTETLTISNGSISKFIAESNVTISQGSKDIKLTSADGIVVGQSVTGDGIPGGTTVVTVNSETNTITLNNEVTQTSAVANITVGNGSAVQLSGGSVHLSNVQLSPQQGVGGLTQSFIVNALGDLTIVDSDLTYATSVDLRTNVNAKLMSTNFQDIEDLSVWADKDITFEAVSVAGEQASANSKVTVTSNRGSVYLNTNKDAVAPTGDEIIKVPVYKTKTVTVARRVNFTANNGDIVINSHDFTTRGAANSEFTANAKNTLGVYNSSIEAAKVSLAANTVVLRDVSFKGGADVMLRSGKGLVAARPGTNASVQQGHVNFIQNVFYGPHEIHLPNASKEMNDAQFRAALTLAKGDHFNNLKIGTK